MKHMSLRCFVESFPTDPNAVTGSCTVQLSEQESRHARLSRRLSVGDEIVLFDGRGRWAAGTIAVATKSSVQVAVNEVVDVPRPVPALTLAVAMPKGPRQDVLIEKCAELGAAAIQPLVTARSVAGVSDHKRDKWRRATIEAAKQSGQCWLPNLLPSLGLDECLQQVPSFDLVLASVIAPDEKPAGILDIIDRFGRARNILALVGPEGGWSPDETRTIIEAGALPVSLGSNVLRIETAAICLAALAHACTAQSSPHPTSAPR